MPNLLDSPASRWGAVALAIAIVVAAFAISGAPRAFKAAGAAVVPLVVILFAPQLRHYRGWWGAARFVDAESPSTVLALFGWIMLLVFAWMSLR